MSVKEYVLYDGKYTIRRDDSGQMFCQRHGEDWRSLTGDGMVLALLMRIDELEEQLHGTAETIDNIRGYDNTPGHNHNEVG